jgi:hypothetical protein
MSTFVFEVKLPISEHHTCNGDFGINDFNDCAIIKLNVLWKNTVASGSVEQQRDSWLNTAVNLVASSDHVIGRDWRMMADLLHVDRTSVAIALVCFSQDRIEGLF